MRLPTPVYMADIARAMQTPPPAQQQPAQAPLVVRDDPFDKVKANIARDNNNERARLRRKAKRAADAKAAKLAATKKAAAPTRKKKKTVVVRKARAAVVPTKKKRRGRPPGAKNKPKVTLDQAIGTAFASALSPQATPARRTATVGMGTDPFSVFLTVRDMLARLIPAQRVQVLAALVNEK